MTFSKKGSAVYGDAEYILSVDFYQHKVIMQAIEAPFKALETGNFKDGLTSVQLSAYMLEKLAWANDVLKANDEEYKALIANEKELLKAEGMDLDSEAGKTRLAYSKIAEIIKRIEFGKSSKTDYHV